MPASLSADDLVEAIHLLLHEVRSPLGVAQGYLRLILDGRLPEGPEREQALAQSLQSLGRIGALCASANELVSDASSVARSVYPAADLLAALSAEVGSVKLNVSIDGTPVSGSVRAFAPAKAAIAIIAVLKAVARCAPADTVRLSAGLHESALVVTVGDTDSRRQLLAARPGLPLRPWGGGHGLLVPVALKQLREMGADVWTLTGDPSAVAIAFPLELE